MNIPRILFAAGASGSGKTLITCGVLQALMNRKLRVASFKCGPDYIDPMFHSRVIGASSRNLDTFFTRLEVTKYLLASGCEGYDIAVMEGVMGYYDGLGGVSTRASACELAAVTDTPVVLIVESRGMSLSLLAYIKGFLEFRKEHHIAGVIFNRMSPMLYPRMKELTEQELGLQVFGYVPEVKDCVIESRHLGLVLPEEIPLLKERLAALAEILEQTMNLDALIRLAEAAPDLKIPGMEELKELDETYAFHLPSPVRIALADDEAFCFFYEDNLKLLQAMGAELIHFSPVHDQELPPDIDGLLLYGGYPELNAAALEKNVRMRTCIRKRIADGLPVMAECGGFMYLHEQMEDMDGNLRAMAGVIPGRVFRTNRLQRFGYVTLRQRRQVFGQSALGEIPAHEFHYFDSEHCGDCFTAQKPMNGANWTCIHGTDHILAGFPHLYYYGNPATAKAFLEKCLEARRK